MQTTRSKLLRPKPTPGAAESLAKLLAEAGVIRSMSTQGVALYVTTLSYSAGRSPFGALLLRNVRMPAQLRSALGEQPRARHAHSRHPPCAKQARIWEQIYACRSGRSRIPRKRPRVDQTSSPPPPGTPRRVLANYNRRALDQSHRRFCETSQVVCRPSIALQHNGPRKGLPRARITQPTVPVPHAHTGKQHRVSCGVRRTRKGLGPCASRRIITPALWLQISRSRRATVVPIRFRPSRASWIMKASRTSAFATGACMRRLPACFLLLPLLHHHVIAPWAMGTALGQVSAASQQSSAASPSAPLRFPSSPDRGVFAAGALVLNSESVRVSAGNCHEARSYLSVLVRPRAEGGILRRLSQRIWGLGPDALNRTVSELAEPKFPQFRSGCGVKRMRARTPLLNVHVYDLLRIPAVCYCSSQISSGSLNYMDPRCLPSSSPPGIVGCRNNDTPCGQLCSTPHASARRSCRP
jgi:hypothetical protein